MAVETIIRVACDMVDGCDATVSMVDDKGFIYCERHGLERRGFGFYRRKCRKLRPHEINRLARGEQLARY